MFLAPDFVSFDNAISVNETLSENWELSFLDEFKGQHSADECESDNDEDIDLETQVNTSDHGISNDTVGLELALKLRDYVLDTGDDKIVRHADELITQLEYRIVGREEQKKQTEITSFFIKQ